MEKEGKKRLSTKIANRSISSAEKSERREKGESREYVSSGIKGECFSPLYRATLSVHFIVLFERNFDEPRPKMRSKNELLRL